MRISPSIIPSIRSSFTTTASIRSAPCPSLSLPVAFGKDQLTISTIPPGLNDCSSFIAQLLSKESKLGQVTLGHRYSTARVSKRRAHQSAACLRARYCAGLEWLDLGS